MRNVFFLLFVFLNFLKIPAQIEVTIAKEICHSFEKIQTEELTITYEKQASIKSNIIQNYLSNLPEEIVLKQKNLFNFINVTNYKIERNLRKNCDVKQPNSFYDFTPLTSVVDFDDTFTFDEFKLLRDKIRAVKNHKSVDLLVLEVDDLYPFEDITKYSFEVLNNWSSGLPAQKGKIIIVFSKDLRQARITTNAIAQQYLDDEFAQKMIDETIIPKFKTGNYYEGIAETLNQIEKIL